VQDGNKQKQTRHGLISLSIMDKLRSVVAGKPQQPPPQEYAVVAPQRQEEPKPKGVQGWEQPDKRGYARGGFAVSNENLSRPSSMFEGGSMFSDSNTLVSGGSMFKKTKGGFL